MNIEEGLNAFIASMEWRPETPDDVRQLVIDNLKGFANLLIIRQSRELDGLLYGENPPDKAVNLNFNNANERAHALNLISELATTWVLNGDCDMYLYGKAPEVDRAVQIVKKNFESSGLWLVVEDRPCPPTPA